MTDKYLQLANVSSVASAAVAPLELGDQRGYVMRLGLLDGSTLNLAIDQVGLEQFRGMIDRAMLASMFG